MTTHGIDCKPRALRVPRTKKLTEHLDPFFLMKRTPYVTKYAMIKDMEVDAKKEKHYFFQLTSPDYPDGNVSMST